MTELYLANITKLKNEAQAGSMAWADIHHFAYSNVCFVDRTNSLTLPYKLKTYHKFIMPTDISSNLTYQECCDRKASELYEKSKRLDLPIYCFYSGGIDSTLVLISFMRVVPKEDWERIVVVMSMDSIREYPRFYKEHIRGNFKIVPSERMSIYFNKKCLIVGGEHNDQLMGTDVVSNMQSKIPFDTIFQDYDKDTIMRYFIEKHMNEDYAAMWYDIIDKNAKAAPCEIKTVHDFFWWVNFNYKWQAVFFRMLLRVDKQYRSFIDDDFVDTYFHHFYSDDYFQVWAMNNKHLKIKDTWQSYKFHAKELIYQFTGDADYRDHKQKAYSLHKLFIAKDTPVALSTNYDYLYKIDTKELYVPENDFIGK